MSQEYKYTAADFERYHSGKMSAREMHALEKAALEDPFLADALEGYAYTDTPVKDIAHIKEKLFVKKKKKSVFFLISKQNQWLRIAAIFILITGIGYMAYLVGFNKDHEMLATKQDSSIKNIVQPPASTNMDSTLPAENKDVVAAAPLTKNNDGFFKEEAKLKYHDMKNSREEPAKSSSNPVQESLQKSVRPNAGRDVVYLADKTWTGRVVDTTGKPVSFASISTKDRNIVTRTDSAGRFKLFAKDSSVTAVVSALGYKTKEKKLNDKSEQLIVIQNDNNALEEVVVTAATMQRQKKALSSKQEVAQTTSEPVTGLQEFNEYVKKNIRIPVDAEGKRYKGNVVLSFEINKNGNPKKIKIAQTFCKPCNEEAIRLLKAGPKWKYIENKKQYVAIEF
ncbi:MAG TPA: carboxypeptidase-like regulatory domain-containing protein [Chitinophagaceae bacterium]|nr:carboxypeptidase-like regulatory domain-containing protein [Chitinophagaceae bacterium]